MFPPTPSDPAMASPAPAFATSTAARDDIPGSPQPRGFLPLFVLAWFGVTIALGTISGASIPKALAFLDDATKATNLSIIAGAGGVMIIVITPLFGRLSDRTMSRFGMRRPWLIGGALVATVGVIVLALTQDLVGTLVGWLIVQAGFGASNMVIHALLADQIPRRIRARVAAAAGVATGLGLIVGAQIMVLLPNDQRWAWFVVPGLIGVVLSALFVFRFRDIVRTAPPPPLRAADVLSTYWLSPRRYPDFFWAFFSRFLVTMSITAISTFLLFIIIDRLHVPVTEASPVQALALVVFTIGNIVTAVLFGWISDRSGRRKAIVVVASVLSALGLVVTMLASDVGSILIGIAIVGAAQGAYVSVDVALMTEVLPSFDEAGKDLGIVALSYQIPQLLIPVIALPLLAAGGGGYDAFFVLAIAFAVVGGLAVLPIRSVR
ncbi:permease of the major facilitator superfamily [Microbacterium testaceum StLB037]|uniref:Permease of the major facilitator superfamily n=2 Tax=Microbacterium testaceum TaxID=2033 RepID=E8N8K1_MICTS|nr:permease of the major facilitator superfamily [Microbacterium testaceum StLB037]